MAKLELSSPPFLFFRGEPGALEDVELASRLSYFLWNSSPDEELFRLAKEQNLSDPKTLESQVDRMLGDELSKRFVEDFLDQWIGSRKIDATTPDDKLYPEPGDVLRRAMLEETELFFEDFITTNVPARLLIDVDDSFLNRRLAEDGEIRGIEGEHFRRVSLAPDRVRGGWMKQASVLKITANGAVTSPVKRRVFVLSTLLGKAPRPPPSAIGSAEPDTRGTTTIRETLAGHRVVDACASRQQHIDPPGFSLESSDPNGGLRARYRSTAKGDRPMRKLFGSHLGNANAHDPRNLPVLLAGGGFRHGQCFAHDRDNNTPLCNLFASLLQRPDIDADSFATSSGSWTW